MTKLIINYTFLTFKAIPFQKKVNCLKFQLSRGKQINFRCDTTVYFYIK